MEFVRDDLRSCSAFVGLDGFVDEIIHVVSKRLSPDEYIRMDRMTEFGDTIVNSSGLSSNFEFVSVQKKFGGNGPIFAQGLYKLGVDVKYFGCVGDRLVDPIFQDFAKQADLVPLANPGHTQAIEFNDGKLICSSLEPLNHISWDMIKERMGIGALVGSVRNAGLISLNNWTMIPEMNRIWEGFLSEIIPHIRREECEKKVAFFDLADPGKRTASDILKALSLIGRFHEGGFRTVLGLNMREAWQIYAVLGYKTNAKLPLRELCEAIYEMLNIDCLVIHPVDRAVCISAGEYYEQQGPYCREPKLTTGAGDCFNAGFMFGYIHDRSLMDCLKLGVIASGYYVRNACFGDPKSLDEFYDQWIAGNLE